MKWLVKKERWFESALEAGAGAGAGAQAVEAEVEAEVREWCSTGLGNDCAVWKQDGRLAGQACWTTEEGGLSNSLVGLFQHSSDSQSEGPLRELKGIKHMVRMKYDCKVVVLK